LVSSEPVSFKPARRQWKWRRIPAVHASVAQPIERSFEHGAVKHAAFEHAFEPQQRWRVLESDGAQFV
jgi:hypothetical protein